MSNLIKSEALVIVSARWRESSKIVHLFSAEQGYIKLIAKGAYRPKSDFRGVLEALNHIEVIISHKETRSLQLITSASLLNAFLNIREDLQKTAVAFSVLEMFKKLFSVHEPVQHFFHYAIELLSALNDSDTANTKIYLWHFLLQLSKTLGFGWTFEQCLVCKNTPENFPVILDYQNGGILCGKCRVHYPGEGIALNRPQWERLTVFAASEPGALHNFGKAGKDHHIAELTEILLKHLSHHTEVPLELKSLKWYV